MTTYDQLLQEEIEIPADLVVLNAALEGDSTAQDLKQLLKIPVGDGQFFMEAHAKIRPLDFPTDGVYLCGAAHSPKGIADYIAQAVGAASRAAVPMMKGWVTIEPIISSVDPDVCIGCGAFALKCARILLLKEMKIANLLSLKHYAKDAAHVALPVLKVQSP